MEGICGGLGGQIEIEGHFAIGGGGIVGKLEEFAPEGCDCCFRLDGHLRGRWWLNMVDLKFIKHSLL